MMGFYRRKVIGRGPGGTDHWWHRKRSCGRRTRFFKPDNGSGCFVQMQVDPKGYILWWTDETSGCNTVIDLSTVCDTRVGAFVTCDPCASESARWFKRLPVDLERYQDKLDGFIKPGCTDEGLCLFTVVCNPGSLVNVTYHTFLASSPELAKEWAENLFSVATNLLTLNGSVLSFLGRHYARVCHSGRADENIYAKDVLSSLVNSKAETSLVKKIETTLSKSGIFTQNGESVPSNKFREENFFSIYYDLLHEREEVRRVFTGLLASKEESKDSKNRDEILKRHSKQPHLRLEQFVNFLNQEQRDPRKNEILYPESTKESAQKLIDKYEPDPVVARKEQLSFDGFLRYLLSDENGIVADETFDYQPEEMKEPLSHYIINSSHNTYLTGKQLYDKSSIEMYRQVLLAGCRCIELDCWDKNNEPWITHGRSWTEWIPFKETIEGIAESAFKTTDAPLILSLENRCSPENQTKMSLYLRQVLGDMLLVDPLPTHPLEKHVPLPSPYLLKRKILVKNKKAPSKSPVRKLQKAETANLGASAMAAAQNAVQNEELNGHRKGSSPTLENPNVAGAIPEDNDSGGDGDESDGDVNPSDDPNGKNQKEREAEATEDLSAIVIYVQAVRFTTFSNAKQKDLSYEISSFGETKAIDYIKAHGTDLVNHNKRQLIRVYPRGGRIDSSNFLPCAFWNAGVQMAALNFQTADLGLQLNFAFFERNGKSGYWLKPECMRKGDRMFDPFEDNAVENVVANTLSIKIISGQFVADRKTSTYVLVEMYGLPHDIRKGPAAFKTKRMEQVLNPLYDSPPFNFSKIVFPELALLRLAVCEENGKVLGQRFFPVTGLRPGYRHIPLRNSLNQPLGLATLFVYIKVRDYVPDAHVGFAESLVNPIAARQRIEQNERMLQGLLDTRDEEERIKDSIKERGQEQESEPDSAISTGSNWSSFTRQSRDSGQKSSASDLTKSKNAPASRNSSIPSESGTITPRGSVQQSASMKTPSGVSSGSAQPSLLETFKFELPSLQALNEHKKIVTLLQRHQRDLECFRKAKEKELVTVRSKVQKRSIEDPNKGKGLLKLRLTKKTERSVTPELPSGGSNGQLSGPDSITDGISDKESYLREKFYKEELELILRQKDMVCELKTELVQAEHGRNLKRLERISEKERETRLSKYHMDRKTKIQEAKSKNDRDNFNRLRKEAEDESIKKSVDTTRKLRNLESNRKAELEKDASRVIDQLRATLEQEKAEIAADYDQRKNTEYPPQPTHSSANPT